MILAIALALVGALLRGGSHAGDWVARSTTRWSGPRVSSSVETRRGRSSSSMMRRCVARERRRAARPRPGRAPPREARPRAERRAARASRRSQGARGRACRRSRRARSPWSGGPRDALRALKERSRETPRTRACMGCWARRTSASSSGPTRAASSTRRSSSTRRRPGEARARSSRSAWASSSGRRRSLDAAVERREDMEARLARLTCAPHRPCRLLRSVRYCSRCQPGRRPRRRLGNSAGIVRWCGTAVGAYVVGVAEDWGVRHRVPH